MPKFTARLSDGTTWSVDAASLDEARNLVRLEDALRRESGSGQGPSPPPPAPGPSPVGRQVAPNLAAGALERRPGLPPPGPLSPEALSALQNLPPPPGGIAQPLTRQAPPGGIPTPEAPNTVPTPPPGLFTPSPQQLRTGIEGTLGGLGGAAGFGLTGGNPLGLAAGGALGGAAGSFLSEAAGIAPSQSPGEAYSRAGQAAAFEGLAGPVAEAGAAGVRLAQRGLAKLDTQLATLANNYGIRLGIEDLSTTGYLNRVRQIFGRFGLLAKPFQEASARKGSDILAAMEGQLNGVAPTTVDPFVVSRRTLSESRAAWEHYREGVNTRYDAWRANAAQTGVEFSPNITRTRAQELLDEAKSKAAEFVRVDPLTGERMATYGRVQPDPLTNVARKISNLGDNQSVAVYDALRKDLQGMQAKLKSPNDRARVGSLIEGLELDLRSTLSSADSARELAAADRFYKKGKALFETATANRIGGFRKGIFDVGQTPEATSRDIGDAIRTVFQTGNRQAVSEYRNLVGDQTFAQATRLHLQDNFEKAFRVVTEGADAGKVSLDMGALSKNLGLFDPKSERRAALVKMLQGTGVDVRDIENVVRLAGVASKAGPVDVSTFASRRAVMGGLESAVGAIAPGIGKGGLTANALKLLTVVLEGRRFGRWLTDPRAVKNLEVALNPQLQQSVRAAALIRLGRIFENDPTLKGYGVPAATAAGAPVGGTVGLIRQGGGSPLAGPFGALTGALQTGVGAKLSQATARPFRGQQ